jgi:hypothetical protein
MKINLAPRWTGDWGMVLWSDEQEADVYGQET